MIHIKLATKKTKNQASPLKVVRLMVRLERQELPLSSWGFSSDMSGFRLAWLGLNISGLLNAGLPNSSVPHQLVEK